MTYKWERGSSQPLRLEQQQRGESDHREGELRHPWAWDSPGTGGEKEEGELESMGTLIVRSSAHQPGQCSASVPALTLEM